MIRILLPIIGNTVFYEPKYLTFQGVEEHINLTKYPEVNGSVPITIQVQLTSSTEVMRLLLITDALRRLYFLPPQYLISASIYPTY